MSRFFEEHKKKILPAGVIVVVCLSIALGQGNKKASFIEDSIGFVITPFQDLMVGVENWITTVMSGSVEKDDIIKENQLLKQEIANLIDDNNRLLMYEEENARLSELLGVAVKYPDYDTVGTNVTSKSVGVWYQTFVIDKGIGDGVKTNDVLITADGLVGKITESGTTYSKAQTILDSRSAVSAMSSRTKDLGVVKGDYSLMQDGLCKMEYIDIEAQIIIGDEIVTSHLSDIYPEGLVIGRVVEIKVDSNGLTKYAIIEPYVDFKRLATLLVIS